MPAPAPSGHARFHKKRRHMRTPPLFYQAFAELFGGATGMARTTRL